MPSKQTVRCREEGCYWTGQRATEAPLNSVLDKPCPNGHEVVVGGPPPTTVETTPAGIEIAFWDSENVETGQPQQRRYLCDGQKLPSVTTLLRILDKPALLDWAARLARDGVDWRDVRDEAGERGTNAHGIVLDILSGRQRRLSSVPEEYRPYGQAAMAWLAHRSPVVVEIERLVASPTHGYAGRMDLLCQFDGEAPLVDFKSVTAWHYKRDKDGAETDQLLPPYPENVLQLDLYAGAAVESGYPSPDYGLVVRLGPDGTFHEAPVELDPDRGLAILAAYRAKAAASQAVSKGRAPQLELAA